jgi:tetratricopeptide (TPR) repeat protein
MFACAGSGCSLPWKDKLVKSDIVQSRQLTLQGLDAEHKGELDRAEDLFQQAVATCDTDLDARRSYAASLWRQGKTDEAFLHLHEVVRRDGGKPDTLLELGRMYFESGQLDRAALLAEQAILADRQRAEAWELQGRVQLELGRREEALASLHRAMALQERFPVVQMTIARIYMEDQRPQRALATLESLAAQYPKDAEPSPALLMRGLVNKSLGRYPEAIECLAAVVERGEAHESTRLHLAETYVLAGDATSAEAVALSLVQSRPDFEPAQRFLAQLPSRGGRLAALPSDAPPIR